MSRSQAQKWLAAGQVLVQGKAAGKNDKLKAGMQVEVCLPETALAAQEEDGDERNWGELLAPAEEPQPQQIPLQIVYEDEHLLVVDKPKHMVVHPGAGNSEGHWSMHCCTTAVENWRAAMESNVRESFIASTRIPAVCWSVRRMMKATLDSAARFSSTRWTAFMKRWSTGRSSRRKVSSTCPSGAVLRTAKDGSAHRLHPAGRKHCRSQAGNHPLSGAGTVRRFYPPALSAGNRAHPPDSGASGISGSSGGRG